MSNYLNIDTPTFFCYLDTNFFYNKQPDWGVFGLEFSCENTGSRWISESQEELFFYDFKEIS
jgi:hypothetical protein